MTRALRAGLAYFAGVFALGFVLGTVRVLWLAPRLGEGPAVLLELPVMLAASWAWCGWLLGRFRFPPGITAPLLMGGVAFALLMAAEFTLGAATGTPPASHLARWATGPGAAGLAAQIAFALFPLARISLRRKRR